MSDNQAPTMPTTIKRIIATSAEGYPLLGHCIYWSFSETKMSYTQFIQLLQECDINPEIAPETRVKSAVQKAIKSLAKDGGKTNFHRKVIDDKDLAAFAIVRSHVDEAQFDVNFATETKIRMDKKSGSVIVDGSDEAKEAIHQRLQDYRSSYTTDQVRAAVLRFLYDYAKGIMVREKGGLYFIPSTNLADFEKLQLLFEKLASFAEVSIDTIPVIDTKEAAAAMWKSLVGEAEAEMAEMRMEIEALQRDPTDKGRQRRLDKMQKLRTKIEMYEVLLNGTAKELIGKLADTEKMFLNKITELAQAEAEAANG